MQMPQLGADRLAMEPLGTPKPGRHALQSDNSVAATMMVVVVALGHWVQVVLPIRSL